MAISRFLNYKERIIKFYNNYLLFTNLKALIYNNFL